MPDTPCPPDKDAAASSLLQVPFAKHFPIFAIATGLTIAASWLNNRNFKPVYSMAPEYKTKEHIIVSVAESRVC
jgi:hypothetical protein